MTTEDRLAEVVLALENILENVEITPDGVYIEAMVWEDGGPNGIGIYGEGSYVPTLVALTDPVVDALLAADELLNRLDDDSSQSDDDEVDLNEE